MKSLNMKKILIICMVAGLGLQSCSDGKKIDRSLQEQSMLAVLFAQTSPEYAANNIQTYKMAAANIDKALKDKGWTAALEQKGNFDNKPAAIILDVDETVLDNSAFQARAIINGFSYPTGWIEWGNEANAPAVAGVKEFLNYADSKGVSIFYVTNRVAELKEATKDNIIKLGLPFNQTINPLMMKVENNWGSDKTSRRQLISEDYRIILMAGDQITDFISLEESAVSIQKRLELSNKYSDEWGTKWFMITNPMYGKWEGAIYDNVYPSSQDKAKQLRFQALDPK